MYSPTLGRWMQMDPAGYVDGANLYQFVNSQPVNGTDPAGLWEKDFHYNVIYLLMRLKCWTPDEAAKVAKASNEIDRNPATDPRKLGEQIAVNHPFARINGKAAAAEAAAAQNLADYHFPGSTANTPTHANDQNSGNQAGMAFLAGDLDGAGRWLHTYADSWSHDGYTAYYNPNVNSRAGDLPLPPVGHGRAGHTPDIPYLHVAEAVAAAKHIFDLIPSHCKCGRDVPWDVIAPLLGGAFSYRGNPQDKPLDEKTHQANLESRVTNLVLLTAELEWAFDL